MLKVMGTLYGSPTKKEVEERNLEYTEEVIPVWKEWLQDYQKTVHIIISGGKEAMSIFLLKYPRWRSYVID